MQDEDKINGLAVPDSFPSQSYEATKTILLPYRQTNPEELSHFNGAWNAMFYRYISFLQNDELFRLSLRRHGSTPVPEQRYIQENALFCFFSAGFSMVESGCYALYAIASIIDHKHFPVSQKHLRTISPPKVYDQFQKRYPDEEVIGVLKVMTENKYREFKEIRNTLTHRTSPGRIIHLRSGEGPGHDRVIWRLTNSELNESTTESWKLWLIELINDFTDATATFSQRHLVDSP